MAVKLSWRKALQAVHKLDFQDAIPHVHSALRSARHFKDLAQHSEKVFVCMYVYIYIYTFICVCMCVYVCVCVFVCMYGSGCYSSCAFSIKKCEALQRFSATFRKGICVCVCVCVCVYMCVWFRTPCAYNMTDETLKKLVQYTYIHTYIHIYIYTYIHTPHTYIHTYIHTYSFFV